MAQRWSVKENLIFNLFLYVIVLPFTFAIWYRGLGHYTEDDIKEAARAFTGWRANKNTGEVRFNEKQHDQAVKKVLGFTGNFGEEDIVKILLKQNALPQFIARKLLSHANPQNMPVRPGCV